MNPTDMAKKTWIDTAMAVCLGLTIPAILSGRATLGAAFGLATLFALIGSGKQTFQSFLQAVKCPAGLMFAAALLYWSIDGLIVSIDPFKSATAVFRTAFFVVAAVFLAIRMTERPGLAGLALRSAVWAYLVLGVIAIAGLHQMFPEAANWIRGGGGDPKINFDLQRRFIEAASGGVVLMPAIILIYLRDRSPANLALVLAAGAVCVLLSGAVNSRASVAGAFAGSLLALGVLAAATPSRRTRWILILILALTGASVVFWARFLQSGDFHTYGGEWKIPVWLIDPPRQAIWSFSWDLFRQTPWFGVGANVSEMQPGADIYNPDARVFNIPQHPHNFILELLIEGGGVGFGLIIGGVGLVLSGELRRYLRTADWSALAGLTTAAVFFTQAALTVSIWSSWWQLTYLAATVLCLSASGARTSPPAKS